MHPEPLNPAEDAQVDPAPADPTGHEPVDSTGDARVDAAVAGLTALDETELAGHPAVLEAVHDRLREILGELGDAGRPTHSGQGYGGPGISAQGPGGDPRP
jgi:hypothetical protein